MISIDPGYAKRGKGCACARFDGGRLRCVWFARPEAAWRTTPAHAQRGVDLVVWEIPQVDRRTRVSTPHVVQLAAVGGTLAGLYAGAAGARVEPVTPAQWKGATPKPVAHGRMLRALNDAELAMVGGADTVAAVEAAKRKGARDRWSRDGSSYYPSSWLMHNLLDAVGIGLWRLGRIDKEGTAI
jgi:hypothetical protein